MKAKESVSPAGSLFRIAGVTFMMTGMPPRGLKVRNPLYRRFAHGAAAAMSRPAIEITLKREPAPVLATKKRVFATLESWALFADAKRLWMEYRPPKHEKPFWVAAFDRRAARVAFYCPGPGELIHPVGYPLDQLLLMYFLARRRGVLAHAAGVVRGGKAFIFPGVSGAGKSTFSRLLAEAGRGRMLSDERMVVREIGGEMIAFGTPWAGTAGIARYEGAPLAGIFFLRHGKENWIARLPAAVALDLLLPMASIPWYDPGTLAPIIAFVKRLLARTPAYEMHFKPDRSATDFFWKFAGKKS